MTEKNGGGFLEKVRSLDGSLKRNIMIILVFAVVALGFFLWPIYFNDFVIPGGNSQSLTQDISASSTQPSVQEGIGTSEMMSAAWGSLQDSVVSFWQSTTGMLSNAKQYNISPTQ